jgi:Fe-S-cluster-containing dehydrogenase component
MPKHGAAWIDIKSKERGGGSMVDVAYLPVMCQHCDDAPCIEQAQNGAIKKRDDGIVLIDPELAKGQKHLVDACPYGAISWNEDKQVPQHWFFDAHLLDEGWTEPRAAQVCATAAITATKTSDEQMRDRASEENLQALDPSLNTRPRVWYKNLHRFHQCFIGGSVEIEDGGVVDCVKGATVVLYRDAGRVSETQTDVYGDFVFDRLYPDSGAYRVEASLPGREPRSVNTTLGESIYLGEIRL